MREANATGRVLVVDETRSSGGVAEGVVTVRFGDLAVPDPWAAEWNWQMNAARPSRVAAPVNPTTNSFENAMIFALSIGGMP